MKTSVMCLQSGYLDGKLMSNNTGDSLFAVGRFD